MLQVGMKSVSLWKRSGLASLDAHVLREMNNADCILSTEGEVPDFVVLAYFVRHNDILSQFEKKVAYLSYECQRATLLVGVLDIALALEHFQHIDLTDLLLPKRN